ncbi:LOW QUALITY PROTEIN: TOX high mobility group box family member 3-like [Pollicipes pollicipes]|uniref:LOW QUALITY PROTEIN: TOX high mobility group box family member 3-like n=1 Tax=Pollicipes pollicipes TaxID=41117 RepID=UPI00188560C1|nr:LOW QUALITY PROTEIN: TOX high mobility group box family member 3-like [Pollicipes pollicipes]
MDLPTTYQTPSLGDEEFDLPPLLSEGAGQQNNMYPTMEMSAPMTSTVDTMTSVGYQHHNHQPAQHHPMFYRLDRELYQPGAPGLPPPQPPPPRPYPPAAPQPHPGLYAPHELMLHHRVRPPIYQGHGLMGPPATGSPGRINNSPGHTTSEDSSDDSTSRAQWMRGERPSPEPAQIDMTSMKPAKKPRVTRKRKKRDPNEPEKPVSAYALFFRDTQATIKGHNPNASFGEVSKIVASMWEALETDNKNMYKKKTENAKKEYLKALAAYRASLISKNNTEEPRSPSLYAGYGGYGGGAGAWLRQRRLPDAVLAADGAARRPVGAGQEIAAAQLSDE